jgi:hypothetical protein
MTVPEMNLLEEFTTIVDALEKENIDYATCGGLAMAVHGFVRATKDIDLLIKEDDLAKCFQIARSLGYDIEGLPLEFDGGAMRLRRLSKIDKATRSLITIDFLLVTEKTKNVWEERELIQWGSGHAWVVSRNGLIQMKRHAGRDQDLVDIRRLEETNEE